METNKKRVTLRLSEDEVAVVGSVDQWEHLIEIYKVYAEYSDDYYEKEEWLSAVKWVEEWLRKANVPGYSNRQNDKDQWRKQKSQR